MSSVLERTSGDKLEVYTLQAKKATPRMVRDLVTKALDDAEVFVFGELLALPSVQALEETEHKPYLDLLHIFAYGNLTQYRTSADELSLPQLSEAQLRKLRQLTLVSLAAASPTITYDDIKAALEMTETRAMEDLIIECIYASLLVGKFDQANSVLVIEACMGRDMRPAELPETIGHLEAWIARANVVLGDLSVAATTAADQTAAAEVLAAEVSQEHDERKHHMELSIEHEVQALAGKEGSEQGRRQRRRLAPSAMPHPSHRR
ncbi:COP9 signalosome complex subunit 7a [Thecamonas trahens ATCC 50062]|uniref:COP9 signalosome complex subunit 7a n=1 Tax=Thecamonas trahens ATCC 50062 TaxID=461836 RepID=A0A0L0DV73_THETB|nr:COP9 signalosome complex subunit 7a [Thecamonas trahens ATCC 50062]KNC55996.1 COP9 signalosome complex subunit 7a [Thecamonas trahens ATCC 50062]|eukprot:XP_013761042.1 COP9 signalosome complex subunit 7a [Thecamonas trahens ATCC 50062]